MSAQNIRRAERGDIDERMANDRAREVPCLPAAGKSRAAGHPETVVPRVGRRRVPCARAPAPAKFDHPATREKWSGDGPCLRSLAGKRVRHNAIDPPKLQPRRSGDAAAISGSEAKVREIVRTYFACRRDPAWPHFQPGAIRFRKRPLTSLLDTYRAPRGRWPAASNSLPWRCRRPIHRNSRPHALRSPARHAGKG